MKTLDVQRTREGALITSLTLGEGGIDDLRKAVFGGAKDEVNAAVARLRAYVTVDPDTLNYTGEE